MTETRTPGGDAFVMLVSAVIFGFFGFYALNWNTPGVNGQVVPFRVLLGWTLRFSSILFALSALLCFAKPVFGHVLYAAVGVVGAVIFIIVAVMDIADKQHGLFAYAPFILVAFALWNGWSSWQSLRRLLGYRANGEPGGV
jgi:hypothetical protein